MSVTTTKSTTPVSAEKVTCGDLMAFTYWGLVENVESAHYPVEGFTLRLKDIDKDTQFFVTGKNLIESARSCSQVQRTEKVTKTQIVDIFSNCHNTPFTVTFIKANGDERKLRGRLIGIDQKNLGYIDVEDLDKPIGSRFRLVDCRTIKSLIVNGVKYYV